MKKKTKTKSLDLRKIVRESLLLEMQMSHITDVLDQMEGQDLSFDKLMGGKKRIVVPFTQGMDIKHFLEKKGYSVDLETGTATETVETRAGPRERNQRVGKLLGKLRKSLFKNLKSVLTETGMEFEMTRDGRGKIKIKTEKPRDAQDDPATDEIMTIMGIGPGSAAHDDMKKEQEAHGHRLYDLIDWANQGLFDEERNKEIKKIATDLNVIEDFVVSWNKHGGEGLSIVISRAPIDVLRMSDFKHIQSCHSEGGGYFRCAIQESKGHGMIAYLVKTSDLEGVNLERDEIFADMSRGTKGISPIARIRLRKYKHKEDGYEFAVPDKRVYGPDRPGFYEQVIEWSRNSQPEISKSPISPNMFERHGGSYPDTTDAYLFRKFFKTEDISGTSEFVGEDVDPDDEWNFDWEDELQEIDGQLNSFKNDIYVGYEFEPGEEVAEWTAEITFEFPAEMLSDRQNEEAAKVKDKKRSGGGYKRRDRATKSLMLGSPLSPSKTKIKISSLHKQTFFRDWFEKSLKSIKTGNGRAAERRMDELQATYFFQSTVNVLFGNSGVTIGFDLLGSGNPDDYQEFLYGMEFFDKNWSSFREALRQHMIRSGILKPTEFDAIASSSAEDVDGLKSFKVERYGDTILYTAEYVTKVDGAELSIDPNNKKHQANIQQAISGVFGHLPKMLDKSPIWAHTENDSLHIGITFAINSKMSTKEIEMVMESIKELDNNFDHNMKNIAKKILRSTWYIDERSFKWEWPGPGYSLYVKVRAYNRWTGDHEEFEDHLTAPPIEEGEYEDWSIGSPELYAGKSSWRQQSVAWSASGTKRGEDEETEFAIQFEFNPSTAEWEDDEWEEY